MSEHMALPPGMAEEIRCENIADELLHEPDMALMAQTILGRVWEARSGPEIVKLLTDEEHKGLKTHLTNRQGQ